MQTLRHAFDCACITCDDARYEIGLRMVDAIRQQAPAAIMKAAHTGFKSLSVYDRADLLGIELKAALRNRAAVPGEVRR